jgi:hypothetical protein
MITCKSFPEKEFQTKEDLFLELKKNKSFLIAQKKMSLKFADAVFYSAPNSTESQKAISSKAESLDAMLVINTTNLLDSHDDVHIKGIWTKNIKENPPKLLLQEHKMSFNSVISDNVKASIETFTWKELGFKFDGTTEALVFNSQIEKDRNTFMFGQYAKGYVKEHSVGMQYIKLALAINSDLEDLAEEKAIWNKYFPDIANKEKAETKGFFWAITEAKAVEGSAVVKGSNFATPTLDIQASKTDKNFITIDPTKVSQNKNRRIMI